VQVIKCGRSGSWTFQRCGMCGTSVDLRSRGWTAIPARGWFARPEGATELPDTPARQRNCRANGRGQMPRERRNRITYPVPSVRLICRGCEVAAGVGDRRRSCFGSKSLPKHPLRWLLVPKHRNCRMLPRRDIESSRAELRPIGSDYDSCNLANDQAEAIWGSGADCLSDQFR